MTRNLYLMRHAQSAEKQGGLPDNERELTPLGMRQAMQIGNYLHKSNFYPDIIWSSTADRAQHTATLLLDALKLMPEKIELEEELYSASVRTFFQLITNLESHLVNVLMIGHNPAISYLAEYLTKSEIGDIPPAGLVIIQFDIVQWKSIAEGSGKLMGFITPEMLTQDE